MMARAYSLDLRNKVISFISQGGSKREAAKMFDIGEDTIYRWMRLNKLGDLSAKKRTDFPTKIPLETLRKYVEKHPDHILKEIGQAVGLSASNVWKHLKKLDLTRKKRSRSTQNVAQNNAPNFKNN
jgi:transposase